MQTKRFMIALVLLLSLGLGVWSAQASVTVSRIISDHAVLQRDRPLPVWGTASAGEAVTVTLGSDQVTTNANAQGKWSVTLPAQALNTVGQDLTVSGTGNTHVVTDVLIGDVWLCGGQSNMGLPLSWCDASNDTANANFPTMRVLMSTNLPLNPVSEVAGTWKVCTPTNAPDFTGTGFYFARRIQSVTNVPIGLVDVSYGGTPIDSHIGPYGWALEPWLTNQLDYASRIADSSPIDCIYYSKVHPAAPYAIKGALWYQGEWSGGDTSYYRKMRALIGGWRKEWNQGDFPFYYVQIHALLTAARPLLTISSPPESDAGGGWAITRQMQFKSLQITNTGMALTIDIGAGGLHPLNKFDVGERLALWALRDQYGSTNPVVSGPLYREMQIEGNTIRLKFDYVGSGLMVGKKTGKNPTVEDVGTPLNRFTIAGDDQVWVWANAVISGNEVRVWSPAVTNPVAARYAYSQVPDTCNLYNREGLPASPFRTDEWGLMRPQGSNIILCESWPTAWDGDFRFQAPYDTTVEGTIRSNKLTKLVVTPVSRRTDVVITAPYVDPMDFVTVPQPAMGEAPLTVSFDASAVTSYLGPITTYRWDFGNGATALGAFATNTYAASGVYTAMLQVVNALAQTDSVPRLITVTPSDTVPPTVVSVAAPNQTNRSVVVTFSEPVKKTEAETTANYTVTPGIGVVSAALAKDGKTVTLATTPLVRGDYAITVSNIHDRASALNPLATTNLTFRYEALFARWKLDEGKWLVAADESGSGLPGSVDGAIWTNAGGRKALSFNGQWGVMSTPTFLQGLSWPFSITCWVNPAAVQPANANMFGNFSYDRVVGWGGLVMQQDDGTTNRFALIYGVGGTTSYSTPSAQLTADQWQHVAVVCDGTNAILYLNGVEQGRSATAGTFAYSRGRTAFTLGYAGLTGRYFKGALSDFRIYRTALSAAEVQAVSSASGLATPTALIATAVNTHQIQLAWTDNATNETAYVLDRSPDGSAWNALTSLAANATAYLDTGLTEGTRYYYRLAATNSEGASAYASANATTFTNIMTSVSAVSVPEGGTNTFQVRLSSQPTSDVTVAVAWASGDTNLTVLSGANLTFTTNDWATNQTVTLAASEDVDTANGTASITCSSPGMNAVTVMVTEAENDTTLTVTMGTGGTVLPSGAQVVTMGVATAICATASVDYAFTNWSVTSGAATFGNSNAPNTTVTISAPATIQASFVSTRVQLVTSTSAVSVVEGSTNIFQVRLSLQPASTMTVNVARTAGDSDITVSNGASLTFTTNNWNIFQTVTLAAAEDADWLNGSATITCSAPGSDAATVTATEVENDEPPTVATGGTVIRYTQDGTNWTAHVFTNTVGTNFFTPLQNLTVECLVVAGGGGGGTLGGGGGGGGVVVLSPVAVTAGSNYTVVVGGGGLGGSGGSGTPGGSAGNGTNSSAFGATAAGGGGGGQFTDGSGAAGGSGGGAGGSSSGTPSGGTTNGSSLGSNVGMIYGNPGGNVTVKRGVGGGTGDTSGRGGGGAGAKASDGPAKDSPAGAGGVGVTNAFLGTNYVWGGGGGGGAFGTGVNGGAGGIGGGGGGASYNVTGGGGAGGGSALNTGSNGFSGANSVGGAGGINTGGGGGGGTYQNGKGGNGGSGIVIVRYVGGGGAATAPDAPTGFTATTLATNQINLAWTDQATDEIGYVVDRSLDSISWVQVVLTSANATNTSSIGLATNTLYYYRVAASNAAGRSAYCFASARTWSVYEAWQRSHFVGADLINLSISGPTADPDHDGMNNEQEYWAGTIPTNAASCMVLYALTNNPTAPGEYVVRWQSVADKHYSVQATTNLLIGFSDLRTNILATPVMNVHTDNMSGVGCRFYRVKLE